MFITRDCSGRFRGSLKGKTMNTIIGADAAKLAGLQIDMLQKVRSGHLTLAHIEWWQNLPREERDRLSGAISPDPRFTLVKTLDIVVPSDYVHPTQLATFKKEYKDKCYFYNDAITDANFGKVTTQLTPGRKFKVKVFKQTVAGVTTSKERMAFLRSQNAVFTGAQGASLVFAQKRQELPKGYWYSSFDEKEALWQDADGYRRVPHVDAYSDGYFVFDLGDFGLEWLDDGCLLCFCDE